ncbi:MAG: type I secretion system permease/ATPase [Alphaproteobacteria bacterium]|nr:type I secretion system permease/ATPase [Alphaproteobacteria bacterium]
MVAPVKSVWAALDLPRMLVAAFAVVFVFSFFVNLLILTSPVYMMQVFDRVLVTGQDETLFYLTLIALICLVGLGVFDAVRAQLLTRIGTHLEHTLRSRLLTLTISHARLDSNRRLRLTDDLTTIRGYLGGGAVVPMLDAPWAPLFILVIGFMHVWLGVFALVSAIVLFTLAVLNDRLSRNLFRQASAQQQVATEFASAAVANADVIHAMGMQDAISRRYHASVDQMTRASQQAADRSSLLTSISKAIRIAVQVGIMGIGAYLVTKAELTAGGMIAGSIILGRALAPIEQSIGSWRVFVQAKDAYDRIRRFLLDVPEADERIALPDIKGRLDIDKVAFRIPGTTNVVLQRVAFSLEPGTALALIGPSASGKSSLCRLIVGSWAPTAGNVRLDGADVMSLRPQDTAAAIGYLPQSVELFSGTVKQNIARLGEPDDAAIVAAARAAGCHDMILGLEDGYETDLGPQGLFLSGGQRQRIGLARALYGNPSLIVLDEPNANLDQEGEAALIQAIADVKARGATVIIVSHRMSILQPVDKIAILRDGVLEKFGDRDEVLNELNPRQKQAPKEEKPQQIFSMQAHASIGQPKRPAE